MNTRAMTSQEHKEYWLNKVRDNSDDLRDLIANWHPSARQPAALRREAVLLSSGDAVAVDPPSLPITAPNAELACREVRQQIRAEQPDNPVQRFDKAVDSGDVGEIMSLLNGAWFGVPESTACWDIRGFSVAVDLLDDPPDGPEPESPEQEQGVGAHKTT